MEEQKMPQHVSITICDPASIGRGMKVIGCDGLRGYNTHRLKRDDSYYEKEVRLSDEFDKMANDSSSQNALENIVYGNINGIYLEDHEKRLMSTIVQWLGTPVGEGFLRKCGYMHEDEHNKELEAQRRLVYAEVKNIAIFDTNWLLNAFGLGTKKNDEDASARQD